MNLFARRILQVVLVLLVPVFAHGNDKAQPHKHKKKLYQNPSTKKIYTWHHANIYLKVSASPVDSSESYALYGEGAMHQRRLNAPKPIDFEGVGVHSIVHPHCPDIKNLKKDVI